MSQPQRTPNDQRSDGLNPNNREYKSNMENRSNELNPNNDTYWQNRGYPERPTDWDKQSIKK